jgi:5,10-methylenetetrahydromethanopterin reductase
LTALSDALEVIKRLISRDPGGYSGMVFSLEPGARLAYGPERAAIPIMIGTWSRGATRLAARLADEVKIGGSANPAMARRVRVWLDEDLPRFGRARDEVGVVMGAVTVIGPDGREARQRARREVVMYLDVVLELDPTIQLPEGLLSSMRQLLREGDVEAAGRLVPDDILDLFAFAGTPDQLCRQVEDLVRAGVRRVEFGTPHGEPEEEGIRLLGDRVLPSFR